MIPGIVDSDLLTEYLEWLCTMGATCPQCGGTNTHRVQVKDNGVVVRTYFECNSCGHVW